MVRYNSESKNDYYVGDLDDTEMVYAGVGLRKYPNGDIYYGHWMNGKYEGYGACLYSNGLIQICNWKEDNPLEDEVIIKSIGDPFCVYLGERENGRPQRGIGLHKDGKVFAGEWFQWNGESFDGKGCFSWPDGRIYSGLWKNGRQDNGGVIIRPDRSLAGSVSDVEALNKTVLFNGTDNRVMFYGQYQEESVRNGEGVLYYSDKSIFYGTIKDGAKDGYGWYRYPDGSIYIGEWRHDKEHGNGLKYVDKNELYVGQFKDGKYDGYGCIFLLASAPIAVKSCGKWNQDVLEDDWKSFISASTISEDENRPDTKADNQQNHAKSKIDIQTDGITISDEEKSIKSGEAGELPKSPFDFYNIDKSRVWGPDRPVYSRNDSVDIVCFNSITDNPKIGDERNFIRIREAGTKNKYVDAIDILPGKQYEIAIWYHNNSDVKYNESGYGLAINTRVATCFPTKIPAGHRGVVRGIVSSTNAKPEYVWDSCYLKTDSTVWCSYIPNSAILHCKGKGVDGIVLSPKAFFSQGSMIAFYDADNLWGVIPGGDEYEGYVTYCIRVDKPGFWFESSVKKKSQDKFSSIIDVKAKETITIRLYYKNTGTTNQTTVVAYDNIPPEMEYIENTAVFKPAYSSDKTLSVNKAVSLSSTQAEKLFGGNGLIVGDYRPGDSFIIEYDALIIDTERFSKDGYIQNDAGVETANGSMRCKVRLNRGNESGNHGFMQGLDESGEVDAIINELKEVVEEIRDGRK